MNVTWFQDKFNGETYAIQTRTRMYIVPCLKHYKDLPILLSGFSCTAVGMADLDHPIWNSVGDNYIIFLLNIDRSKDRLQYSESISRIRRHEAYLSDYAFGDLLYDKLHALVLKIPESYHRDYTRFRMGKYSKMYKGEVDKYLSPETFAYKVITKSKELQQDIKNSFGYTKEDFPEEFDEYVKIEEETFNHPLFNPTQWSVVNSRAEKINWL